MTGTWRCRARVKRKKGREPCDHDNLVQELSCVECGAPCDPSRTLAGDIIKAGDVVKTPEGWHRTVAEVDATGQARLYADGVFDTRKLKRLFPLYRPED